MNDLKGIIEDCNKSDLVSDKIIKKIIEIIGREEWHDLHDENNDICTTMGELIITLKCIAELEQENAELKEFVNAPHTKGRKTTRGDYIKTVWDLSKQLTKAKEIITELLKYTDTEAVEMIKEAKQFLKE